MATRRRRNKLGRFVKKTRRRTTRRRRNPPTRKRRRTTMATRRRTTPRRRVRRRRNPPTPKLGTLLRDSTMGAAGVVAGEVAVAQVQKVLPLPTTGMQGKVTQVGVALGVAFLAHKFAGRKIASSVAAGAMSVPLRELATDAGLLGAYVQPGRMGAYVQPRPPMRRVGMGAYPNAGGAPRAIMPAPGDPMGGGYGTGAPL